MTETSTTWATRDLNDLHIAVDLLEGKSFAMLIAQKVGMPIESLMRLLPEAAQHSIATGVNRALEQCLKAALNFGRNGSATKGSKHRHTIATAATGAVGGFFGLPGLLVELPVTTTVMLHSIAEIARAEGEDLSNPDSALACLEVFALGPEGSPKGAMDSAYYATRAALAQVTRDAATYVAQKGLVKEGAPVMLSFLSKIGARFGLEVSEKAAAQLIPIAGAAGGLALNVVFMRHFQRLAQGHFIIRRLERGYGPAAVQAEYQAQRRFVASTKIS